MPLKDLFQTTALVFIGTARSAPNACKDVAPPCTGVAFDHVDVVAGKRSGWWARDLAFALPEGSLPDGRFFRIVGAPTFVPGQRYLVFVRGGEWHLTPATNWVHSVFREVDLGPEQHVALFADYQGLAVTGLDEAGFRLGERIAVPNDLLARPIEPESPGRSGVAQSQAPIFSEKVQRLLASRSPEVAQLGIPKDKLVSTLAEYARRYGMHPSGDIRRRPANSVLSAAQATPDVRAAGLEKAAPEPMQKATTIFPKLRVKDTEPRIQHDGSTTRKPAAGSEVNHRPSRTPQGGEAR